MVTSKFYRSIATAALLGAVSTASSAATVNGACGPTAIKFAYSDKNNSTSDGSFVAIPGMNVQFTIGGTKPSCIVVDFQAETFAAATGNRLISLDARLDNDDDDNYLTKSQPQFAAGDTMWEVMRSIKFIWNDVPPGTHRVQVFWRSANGGVVTLNNPTIVVHYEN